MKERDPLTGLYRLSGPRLPRWEWLWLRGRMAGPGSLVATRHVEITVVKLLGVLPIN